MDLWNRSVCRKSVLKQEVYDFVREAAGKYGECVCKLGA